VLAVVAGLAQALVARQNETKMTFRAVATCLAPGLMGIHYILLSQRLISP
jgi:hypothetical protein